MSPYQLAIIGHGQHHGTVLDALVLQTVNCSVPIPTDVLGLVRALRADDESSYQRMSGHLGAFFTELGLEAIESFVTAHEISFSQLAATYRGYLEAGGPPSEEMDDWIRYLENAPQAGASGPR